MGRVSRAALVAAGAALMGAGSPSCTRTGDAPVARRSVSDAGGAPTAPGRTTDGIEITQLDAAATPAVDTQRLPVPVPIYGTSPPPEARHRPNQRPPRGSSKAKP